jgi:hypothetical protein
MAEQEDIAAALEKTQSALHDIELMINSVPYLTQRTWRAFINNVKEFAFAFPEKDKRKS